MGLFCCTPILLDPARRPKYRLLSNANALLGLGASNRRTGRLDALGAGEQLRLARQAAAAVMAHAGEESAQRYLASAAGGVRLVQHAHLATAVALDAQEPRREGTERLGHGLGAGRQWLGAVAEPVSPRALLVVMVATPLIASARSMPCDAAGALAIRSGEQHGLNVIVVIDQQSLDRSGRPMQAGSEIFRQRLPMREDLPLEGDGPALGEGATARSTSPSYRESSVINVDLVFPTSGAKCLASAARFGNCWPW